MVIFFSLSRSAKFWLLAKTKTSTKFMIRLMKEIPTSRGRFCVGSIMSGSCQREKRVNRDYQYMDRSEERRGEYHWIKAATGGRSNITDER